MSTALGHRRSAAIGAASIELGIPIDTRTRANVGSVAKQFTGHLAVLSARRGHLQLQAPAKHYLPRLQLGGVTILDLLRHRGGVRDVESLLSLVGFRDLDHYSAGDLLELAYRQQGRAGTAGQFLYSNTGYLLVTSILESVHSAPLEVIANELVFSPIGMSETAFRSDPREVLRGAASAYRRQADGGWLSEARPVALAGPGSLWTTLLDLDRWLSYLWESWTGLPPGGLPFDAEVPYLDVDSALFSYGAGLYAMAGSATRAAAVFHAGNEHGFSAASYLTRRGVRINCWLNFGNLRADDLAARVFALSDDECDALSDSDLEHLLVKHIESASVARSPIASRVDARDHDWLGTYACEEVPGTIRLSRSRTSQTVFLWRRGTADELCSIGLQSATYAGPGYTIRLDRPEAGLIIDLERAPGLHYARVETE